MNKEITIYELLGLIKDGQAPKKIKYKEYIYEYQHRRDTIKAFNYICNENGEYLSRKYFIDNILNDEIKIIEEDKKIKKINYEEHVGIDLSEAVCNKINELIDEINYIRSNK